MSGLTNFLAPYSNLIFSHRNTIIVVLGIILGCTALYALYGHWRLQRLEREVRVARSGGRQPAGRYVGVQPVVEESPPEAAGGLPPVKGGRTYARNLGSALQKAGMSPAGQPIYSPPVPQGWTPNTAASQPIAPPQQPLYSPASTSWGAPAPSPTWPSAYPAPIQGPGRPGLNQPLPQVPMFQPPAPASQPPQGPAFYPPAYPPAPQMAPTASQVPAQSAPPLPPMAPAMPGPVPAGQPPDPASQDSGRRGKGKRRRFNLSVLESLEKIVQPRQPAQTNQPNPAAAAQVPPMAPPRPAMPNSPPLPAWGPPAKAATAAPSEPAVVQAAPPTQAPAPVEAPSLSLNFESPPPTSAPALEPVVESKSEPRPDVRQSMRSMLFGEEPTAITEAGQVEEPSEPAEDPAPDASVPLPEAEVEPWPQKAEVNYSTGNATDEPAATEYSWQRAEPPTGTVEPLAESHEPVAESHEPAVDNKEAEAETHEPAAESHESANSWSQRETKPWEPLTWSSETSTLDEAAPVVTPPVEEHTAEPEMAESSGEPLEPPAASDGGGAAGTMVIIEDDQAVAQYYATLFQGNGYRVEVANDGVSGVDLCTRVQPQVILLDVMMPRQNGILVLQTLRASDETKNTPVVVMSNFSEPTLIKRALQLGALEYVIKTQVEGPALLAAVPRWMNREKAFAA
jgi:CheY-like chemotaxis protein